MAEANNVVWETAGERVLEDSPVRKSGNHELLSSPDPVIVPYVVLVVPVVVPVVVVAPVVFGVVGVVLLADF